MVRAMPSTDVRRLKQALDRIENERDRLDKLAEHFRGVIDYYEEVSIDEPPQLTPAQEMDNAIERIFNSVRSYMHPKALYDRLTELGIKVPGENPVNNTRSHLSLDDRFEPVGNGLWGLTDWHGQDLRLLDDAENRSQSQDGQNDPISHHFTDITGQTIAEMRDGSEPVDSVNI